MVTRLVVKRIKIGDCHGDKTRIFEIGTEDFVRTLPAANGK
jgi:hypothetical protein